MQASESPKTGSVEVAVVFPNDNGLAHLRGQQVLLCICNCEDILAIRKLVLESFGYEVLTTDGIDGINTLANHPVDLAILDYRAPGTNGELIAIKLKIIQPLTPILMLVDEPATVPESVAKLVHALVTRESSPIHLLEEIARIMQAESESSRHVRAAGQAA
jgi:CheY-like chemotaxis protein